MNISTRRVLTLGALASAVCTPLAAQAALFTNGGFESPGLASGARSDIGVPGLAPTGWTAGGTLGNQALFYESTGAFAGFAAKDGSNAVGFGGNGTTGASISQLFDTVAGATYTVSFFTTAQQLGAGAQSYRAEALAGNSTNILGTDVGVIPELNSWINHTFSFVAAGASSTLRFTDTSNGTAAAGINWALDAVSVSGQAPTGLPEPGSIALVLTAGLLALRVRRS
jgi:Protein of unknown function (DUF642)